MTISTLLSAATAFIWGKGESNSESPTLLGKDSPDICDQDDVIQRSRASGKTSLPFQCHPACSEVDNLIARVISIDLENEDENIDIIPSIEDSDDYLVPGGIGALTFKAVSSENSPIPSRVQHINGFDIEGKYISQVGHARHLCALGWNIESILVYLKLARRGYEPLFSTAWKLDFPKFPTILFTHDDNAVFIKGCRNSLSHGVLDFDRFCGFGRDIRSAERRKLEGLETSTKLTTIANRAIQKYIKAIWKDACLLDAVIEGRLPELIVVVTSGFETTIENLSEFAEQKLHERASEILEFLRCSDEDSMNEFIISPPIVFGIVAYDTIVGVMACEPLTPRMEIRNIGFYHFNKQHEEVWNCISLAILIHWARNSMLRMKDTLGINLGRTRSVDDPDL